jgi:hypothetical protein
LFNILELGIPLGIAYISVTGRWKLRREALNYQRISLKTMWEDLSNLDGSKEF